jgi:hypothetical protein
MFICKSALKNFWKYLAYFKSMSKTDCFSIDAKPEFLRNKLNATDKIASKLVSHQIMPWV